MNRRRFFLALAVVVPLVTLGAAKWAMRFRPVKVGALLGAKAPHLPVTLRVSARYVIAGTTSFNAYTLFDLKEGTRQRIADQTLIEGGAGRWQIRVTGAVGSTPTPGNVQLVFKAGDGSTRAYALPNLSISNPGGGYTIETISRQTARVSSTLNRVELMLGNSYYRWNQTSRVLERQFLFWDVLNFNGFLEESVPAIARDGESVVLLNSQSIVWRSTRTGKVGKRITLQGFRPANQTSDNIDVSTYGHYALYRTFASGVVSTHWQLRDARNGCVLRTFQLDSGAERAIFSPDETLLAVPRAARGVWEVRATENNQLVRTLSLLPGVQNAAFSPDNATLYIVANGVLYRQRAR